MKKKKLSKAEKAEYAEAKARQGQVILEKMFPEKTKAEIAKLVIAKAEYDSDKARKELHSGRLENDLKALLKKIIKASKN